MEKMCSVVVSVLLLHAATIIADDTITVVCTTTALEALAAEVGGDQITLISLVQPGVCPSHFDVKPSHIAEVQSASVILYHGVEPWLEDLVTASGNESVERILLEGRWNTPPFAVNKIEEIRDVLSRIDSENASFYSQNAEQAIGEINQMAEAIQAEAHSLQTENVPVLCMDWQKSLAEWMGFPVVAAYAPPETLSMKDINDLIAAGKNENAILVIDNLQSGTALGAEIAAEIGAYQVVLTNFPRAVPETDTIGDMLEYNARQLLNAVEKYHKEEKILELESELEKEKSIRQIFEAIAILLLILCIVEAVVFYMRRKAA
ncbi:MAG: zinc ABC transporter substrate-binding protein [Theionarchaea archaeon]|nr:MAG: hypothetical protein AYK18_07285 [Theionarchaea archaeon DG-70]MBU7013023.1 zinc ABC transporter substrate-binding protein [Theionarchaea archaeon]